MHFSNYYLFIRQGQMWQMLYMSSVDLLILKVWLLYGISNAFFSVLDQWIYIIPWAWSFPFWGRSLRNRYWTFNIHILITYFHNTHYMILIFLFFVEMVIFRVITLSCVSHCFIVYNFFLHLQNMHMEVTHFLSQASLRLNQEMQKTLVTNLSSSKWTRLQW